MTTNQTTISEVPADITGTSETRRGRVTETVRRNPKKTATATTLVLAAAAAAALLLARRRSAKATARSRNRLAALLHR
ncbi:hypothetical protein Aph02nite_43550 [Actinoplanes philippinensis]|uniref:Uncharacterized protein n=1 Tax=Actinoplanes philippinensis TaxID=35752 RepID=A0A1I2H3M6_9ACTN|nr:hypothetical protein [Actinoplanes philippinensis]GIE78405.1 hypothetical protein Aph02nite_43550 [Actinoplanes philippinensis]SFF24834.1 hypothetical protein SAMN05421541_107484 [Actinoplanes philippinensis]